MTGHEVGAALGVAVLSAVASCAGPLTTVDRAAAAFSRGFVGAAVLAGVVAVFALLRMPAIRTTRWWRAPAHALIRYGGRAG
jgi:hypothetical protein